MNNQWIRKVELFIFASGKGIDLSQFRIVFNVKNACVESPNNAAIRVYNLSKETIARILNKGEYNEVVLNAGYINGNFGAIFKGTIKQFRQGRENATDTYLDILAADGDIGYNQGVVNTSLAKNTTPEDAINAIAKPMTGLKPPDLSTSGLLVDKQHVPSIRGQTLFGMSRARLREYANTLDATWSIQNGQLTIISKTGYLPGETVDINVATGLIGLPVQTGGGIYIKCLLNSRLRIGGAVKLNNDSVVQLSQRDPNAASTPYNQRTGIQPNAALSPDGKYQAYVVEHEGDSWGEAWYSDLVCLAINPTVPANESIKGV